MIKGDHKAFERLYNKYWAKVYHFTSIYINDEYEREEIVQKVFIRFWDARERLDPQKSPDGLLFIITRNIIFNQIHRRVSGWHQLGRLTPWQGIRRPYRHLY